MSKKTVKNISRHKMYSILDKRYLNLDEMKLQLKELEITYDLFNKLTNDSFSPYINKQKIFTKEILAKYTLALSELQKTKIKEIELRNKIKIKEIEYNNLKIRLRRTLKAQQIEE